MRLEVSVGEAIDKLSILEIKLSKITDEQQRNEIQKEINALSECLQHKHTYEFYYNILMYVNERIWTMTDDIKQMTPNDPSFAHIANKIFEFNQKRFRIKTRFNLLTSSNIKEQKSYAASHCQIDIDSEGRALLDEEFTKTISEFKKWCLKQEKPLQDIFIKVK